MPNIKSMVKDLKRNERRRLRNQSTKSALKTHVKKVRKAIGTPEGDALLQEACSLLDKAAERGIIHKNQAARRKSRLMKAVLSSRTNA